MTTPLHLLAYALTPKYYGTQYTDLPGRLLPYRDIEVSDGYTTAFERLFPDDEVRNLITDEFIQFVEAKNLSNDALRHRFRKDAHSWWYLHGQRFQRLEPLAMKVISQIASSFASERNWSTYSFIHSVKHNRLQSKRAENLVYVHYNLRLLLHKTKEYKEGETKRWDVGAELADLDIFASQLTIEDFDNFDAHTIIVGTDPIGLSSIAKSTNVEDYKKKKKKKKKMKKMNIKILNIMIT